jgi:hypothetical protein
MNCRPKALYEADQKYIFSDLYSLPYEIKTCSSSPTSTHSTPFTTLIFCGSVQDCPFGGLSILPSVVIKHAHIIPCRLSVLYDYNNLLYCPCVINNVSSAGSPRNPLLCDPLTIRSFAREPSRWLFDDCMAIVGCWLIAVLYTVSAVFLINSLLSSLSLHICGQTTSPALGSARMPFTCLHPRAAGVWLGRRPAFLSPFGRS